MVKTINYTIGSKFPAFNLMGSEPTDKKFVEYDSKDLKDKWFVIFFYPYDFTHICPTEIEEFGRLAHDFYELDCPVFACSTDSEYVHNAWREKDVRIKNVPYPILSDKDHKLSSELGILTGKGHSMRATYIVNDENSIMHLTINADSVGRKPAETLRTLKALQYGEPCVVNWGEKDGTDSSLT
jgi:peroxiredoxin (alkyl hydroperoxide reductase subunit C)